MQHLEMVRMGFFNLKLQQRVNEKRISAAELARRTGISYEHLRKLLRGDSLPSNALLARLCSTLRLNRKEMRDRVRRDRFVFRFGEAAWSCLGLTPRQGDLEMLFSIASPEQQEFMKLYIISFAEAWKRMESLNKEGGEGQVNRGSC